MSKTPINFRTLCLSAALSASLVSGPALASGLLSVSQAGASASASASTAKPKPPEKVARDAVDELLKGLEGNREAMLKDPEQLYALVDRVLIPLIDVDHTSRLVLGRAWTKATPEQKERFIRAFKVMMIRTYGNALVGFERDQIEFEPLKAEPGATDVTFRANALTDDGDKIPVNLNLHLVNNQWKVYNGSVGSLSFVTSYRAQFAQQIKHNGLEKLIQQLERRYNLEGKPIDPTQSS
jgi:phospholipid transport system substrate-binding protein